MDTSVSLENNKVKKVERSKIWPPPKNKHDPKKPAEKKQHQGRKIKERLATTSHIEVGVLIVPIDNRYLDFNQEP